jgi:hypothetical protein
MAGSFSQFLAALQPGLNALEAHLTTYIVAASAIGVTSMALIQTLKDQLPLRKWYQEMRLCRWIKEGLPTSNVVTAVIGTPTAKQVEADMLTLALDGDGKAFYALDIDKLCGQLNAAAQSALQTPKQHAGFLAVLASEADPNALALVLAGVPVDAGGIVLPITDPAAVAYAAARTQIGQQIQRAIDALQLSITADWQVHLQQAALALSIALAWAGAHATSSLQRGFSTFFFTIFTGVIAGFLAPVSRDLIAALQNLRS